jgi:hypothetical protein
LESIEGEGLSENKEKEKKRSGVDWGERKEIERKSV